DQNDHVVTWSSGDSTIATVSSTGLVTAVAPGTVSSQATSEGQVGQASLEVDPVPAATVNVSLATSSINVGATTTATATVQDSTGAVLKNRPITWGSSDSTIATVSATGTV